MNLVLILVFFLCLMFLTMIFGERLSLFGFLDGRWLTAPFDMAAAMWDMVCELADRLAEFIYDHFWWVTATVSGSLGIGLIALIMVSGLSDEAHAIRSAERSPMNAGGVLDQIPELDTDSVLQTRVAVADDDSHLVYQRPSGYATTFPKLRPLPEIDFAPLPQERKMPPLPRPSLDFNRGRLVPEFSPMFVVRHGHPVRSERVDRMIQRTILSLRNDSWETFSNALAIGRPESSAPPMREDTEYAVADLYERVHVFPGDQVTSRSLHVEKLVPEDPSPGDFELQLRITNRERGRINGLIVRELLPPSWKPINAQPLGVFRDSVVTWLVDGIDPYEERVLTLQVRSTEAGRFQPTTEISATAAVSSAAPVAGRLPAQEERLPPVARRPDVRVALARPPETVSVDEWVDVVFAVTNVGDAPAEGVKLRVNLPVELDHHDLNSDDINRWVDSKIRRLEPQERRLMKLTVQPTLRGRHTAIAELLFQGAQLDKRKFDVVGSGISRRDREDSRQRPSFP